MQYLKVLILAVLTGFFLTSCGGDSTSSTTSSTGEKPKSMLADPADADPLINKGVGPIKEVKLDPEIDQELVAKGKEVYELKCSACHKADKKFIGPAPAGIMKRRSPEWIMNMILDPEKMVKEDPIAKDLLIEYNMSPMANQNLTEEEARSILEYFRTL